MCLYNVFLCHIYKFGCFRTYRNKVATAEFIPWPIEIRFCDPKPATNQTKTPPRLAGCSIPISAYTTPVFYAIFYERFGRRRKKSIRIAFRNTAILCLPFSVNHFHIALISGILNGTTYYLNYLNLNVVWDIGLEQRENCQMIRPCIGTYFLFTVILVSNGLAKLANASTGRAFTDVLNWDHWVWKCWVYMKICCHGKLCYEKELDLRICENGDCGKFYFIVCMHLSWTYI